MSSIPTTPPTRLNEYQNPTSPGSHTAEDRVRETVTELFRAQRDAKGKGPHCLSHSDLCDHFFRQIQDQGDWMGIGPLPSKPNGEAYSEEELLTLIRESHWHCYYHQPLNEEESEAVNYLITRLGGKSLPSLMLKQKRLQEEGDKLVNQHPFRVFAHIFQDPKLNELVRSMNGFVWSRFRDDWAKSIQLLSEAGYITGEHFQKFCDEVGVSQQDMRAHFENGAWAALLDDLIATAPRT